MADRVTIVGAGVTGLTLGWLCARAGHRVAVVDPGLRLGTRTGLMATPASSQQESQFRRIWRWGGEPAVRSYARQVQLGQHFVLAAAGDLGVPVERATMATVSEGTQRQLATTDQPMVDPMAYRDALAASLTAAGGELLARMPSGVEDGWVVSTTAEPAFDGVGVKARLRPATWNWVAFTTAAGLQLPTRHVVDLDREGWVLSRIGDTGYLGSRRAPGIDWVTRHVRGAEVLDQWRAPTAATFDAMPFVGYAGERSQRRLLACGFDVWELTLGTAAALQLAGLMSGTSPELPWQPMRLPKPASIGRAVWAAVRRRRLLNPVPPFSP